MKTKLNRMYGSRVRVICVGLMVVCVIGLLGKGMFMLIHLMRETGMTPVVVGKLLFDTGVDLSAIDGRVNVALLGVGGGNHDGADLTDTILVLSFRPSKQTLGMISVPRDIWSDTLKDKVNSAYHYGEEKKKGGGLVLSKAIVSDMVGLPIQYGLVFDFTKFQTIINLVGGVDIDVPEAFTDTQYPIAGKENDTCNGDTTYACRYETLRFTKGKQHMDGALALKYVRSRHAEGAEGNDFARGRRQQQILVALKEKLTSKEVLQDPQRVTELYRAFDDATDTDMNIAQLATIGKLFLRVPQSQVTRISIESQLYEPPTGMYGRYVLLPSESFDSIQTYVKGLLK